LLPYILFEKYIYILKIGNGQPRRGTNTVPIVSAHFRSLLEYTCPELVFSSVHVVYQTFMVLLIVDKMLIADVCLEIFNCLQAEQTRLRYVNTSF